MCKRWPGFVLFMSLWNIVVHPHVIDNMDAWVAQSSETQSAVWRGPPKVTGYLAFQNKMVITSYLLCHF